MSNRKLITLNLAILILGLLLWKISTRWAEWDIGVKFIVIMIGLIVLAVLTVTFILPTLGDMVANFFYSAPEKVEPDAHAKAASKLAQGDYAGAIREYQAMAKEAPNARFPIVEIAKIQLEKLEQPDLAIQTLELALAQRAWPEDDEAFMLFRIAELHLEHRHDPARASEYLHTITERFPSTRHSANATHRLRELENLHP